MVKVEIPDHSLSAEIEELVNRPADYPQDLEKRIRAYREGPYFTTSMWVPGENGPLMSQVVRRFATEVSTGAVLADEHLKYDDDAVPPTTKFKRTHVRTTYYYKGKTCKGQENSLLPLFECEDPFETSDALDGSDTDWEAYTGRTVIDDSFDGVSFQGLVVYNWITSDGVPLFRVHFPDNDFQDLTLTELRSRLTED